MESSSKRKVEDIFVAALDLQGQDRAAFVRAECADDERLFDEVSALLAAAEGSVDYFERLPQRLAVVNLPGADADRTGRITGHAGEQYGQYMLTHVIGSGGMGTVWRGVRSDGRYEGEVAVKLLAGNAGSVGLERFQREGRYLARLMHPGIARLLDAGVAFDDQPFLVLELVQGTSIDHYSDEHALNLDQRIELFLSVLAAVAHAHARLVVHRDIKPSNIMISPQGEAKLLDFGVAKLIEAPFDDDAGLTRQLGAALTPQFAAPEQFDGGAVTTATDVYSLGLVLALLIVGRNPRDTSAVQTLSELRDLVNREPTRLFNTLTGATELAQIARRRNTSIASLLEALHGDLDHIVRKALAVDPQDRYATVEEFAQDLRRYLHNEPVSAQVPTVTYRLRKFVRRHRGGVLGATATLLAVVGAAGVAIWQGMEAQRQRDVAIYEQQRTQATNDFLGLLLNEIGPDGRPLTLVELLDRGVEMLDRQYGTQPRLLAPMWYELASGYFSLGRNDRLLELLSRAEAGARQQSDFDLLATTLCTQARITLRNEPDDARRRVVEAQTHLVALDEASIDARASCSRARAYLLELDGERAQAIAELEGLVDTLQASSVATVKDRTQAMNELARLYFNARDLDRALQLTEAVLDTMEQAGLGATAGYVLNAINRSMVLQSAGEIRAAYESQRALADRVQALEAAGRPVGWATPYATSLTRLGRYDEALAIYESELATARSADNAFVEAENELQLGRLKNFMHRFDEAAGHLDRAEAELRKAPGANVRLLQALQLFRAQTLLGRNDASAAKALTDASFERAGYPQRTDAPGLVDVLRIAAQAELAAGNAPTAERYASDFHARALAVARSPQSSADVGQALVLRARARIALDNHPDARTDLEAALPSLSNGFGADHPETLAARELLARIG